MSDTVLAVIVIIGTVAATYAVLRGNERQGLVITVLFMLLLLTLGNARADTIGLHIGSRHSVQGFNDSNPGLYVKLNNGLTAGFYCNSESRSELFPDAPKCKLAKYAGYTLGTDIANTVNVSITAGVIAGYARGVTPMVLPTIAPAHELSILGLNVGKPRIAYVPRIDPKRGAHVLHLMLEKEF